MEESVSTESVALQQNRLITEVVTREESRLRRFIRKRVLNANEVEDILQDVFYELVESYRLMKPIEQVSAWLFRVTRNRLIDFFRKKKPEMSLNETVSIKQEENRSLEDFLPSLDAGPEAEYARSILLEELDAALLELPDEQREVFVFHELEGKSYKELAADMGVSVNTLLSRKHYAVLHLRRRLKEIYEAFL